MFGSSFLNHNENSSERRAGNGAFFRWGERGEKMARDFARKFYNSQTWHNARNAYIQSVGGLCERCLAKGLINPAEIVHHKIELTPDNITSKEIATGADNLEALCRSCHAEEHEATYLKRDLRGRNTKRRWKFDKRTGKFLSITPPSG